MLLHGESTIFSIEDVALDTNMTLRSALNCPVEYINKEPPILALKNYCFVIDGDLVNVDRIIENSKYWWKQTSSRVRYYLSKEMKTFYEVDALLCRGELRCAYMRRGRAASIEQIPLDKIFRVARIYSHWKTCISFRRIISDISPVTKGGIEFHGFQRRIFVQYLWRTNKLDEKQRVAREYRASKIPIASARKNDQFGASLKIARDRRGKSHEDQTSLSRTSYSFDRQNVANMKSEHYVSRISRIQKPKVRHQSHQQRILQRNVSQYSSRPDLSQKILQRNVLQQSSQPDLSQKILQRNVLQQSSQPDLSQKILQRNVLQQSSQPDLSQKILQRNVLQQSSQPDLSQKILQRNVLQQSSQPDSQPVASIDRPSRHASSIPRLQITRTRSKQRIAATSRITLPDLFDSSQPVSLAEFRKQFQKHQQKFRKK
uniref:Uncharacterized protein n=1 Tax=Setaria digitata TaxID=48799 RepID=A0A915PKD6_9BILA